MMQLGGIMDAVGSVHVDAGGVGEKSKQKLVAPTDVDYLTLTRRMAV